MFLAALAPIVTDIIADLVMGIYTFIFTGIFTDVTTDLITDIIFTGIFTDILTDTVLQFGTSKKFTDLITDIFTFNTDLITDIILNLINNYVCVCSGTSPWLLAALGLPCGRWQGPIALQGSDTASRPLCLRLEDWEPSQPSAASSVLVAPFASL
jgi:hypothetical protein